VPILNFYPSSVRRELWHFTVCQPGVLSAVLLISAHSSVWPEATNMAFNMLVYESLNGECGGGGNSVASCGRCDSSYSNISDISAVSLSSRDTYASTPGPTTPTGNFHLEGYNVITKQTEPSNSSLTSSQWDSQLPTFDPPDSIRWTPSTLGWMPKNEFLNLYKFVVQNSKEPYFQLMACWTPTQQTPAKVYLDYPK
jgi:hypothetical protein